MEKAVLESRIEAIRNALDVVPESYRDYVLANVMYKQDAKTFPTKIWKLWKQRFLFNVAKNLSLI